MICTSCGETITGAYMGDADSDSVYCRRCIMLGLKAARLFVTGGRLIGGRIIGPQEIRPAMDPHIEARHQKYDRPKIWAMCDAGFSDSEIAEEFGTNILTIGKIRREPRRDI